MPTSVLSFSSARLVKTGTWRLLGYYMQAVEAIGKVTADGRSCPVVELRASGTKTKHGNELSRAAFLSSTFESKTRHSWDLGARNHGRQRTDRPLPPAARAMRLGGVVEHYDGVAGRWGGAVTWRGVSRAV
uniref:Uncharacterized protein n=1 Tax=Oryza rufipogon TaxID=4529 RepID=A0A0E0PJI9_ORYRU